MNFKQLINDWDKINEDFNPNWRRSQLQFDPTDKIQTEEIQQIFHFEIFPILIKLKEEYIHWSQTNTYLDDTEIDNVKKLENTINQLYKEYPLFTKFLDYFGLGPTILINNLKNIPTSYKESQSFQEDWKEYLQKSKIFRDPKLQMILNFPQDSFISPR